MNIESLFKNNNKSGATIGGNFVYDAARKGQQDVLLGVKDIDKYTDRGITPVVGENLDAYLPETQSAWTKIGNSIAQTAVAELALGIPKAFADLADIIGTSIFKGNEDYTNPVSKYLEEKQEEFRNFAPIYVDPNVNIDNGGLSDVGWWASNAPSIVSSLTLMLPGGALTKGVSALAKLGKVGARSKAILSGLSGAAKRVEKGKDLTKFQRFITSDKLAKGTNAALETVSTAAISRTVENYQEGRQTYNDMYVQATEQFKDDKKFNDFIKRNEEQLDNDGVDKNNKDEVAKYIANKAADETFKLDYLNTVFDIIQLGALKNAWKTVRNAPNTGRKIRQINKQAAREIGKTEEEINKLNEGISKLSKVKDWTLNNVFGSAKLIGAELSEGVEEAVNYIAQQEGMTFGNTLLTGEGTYSDFWDRVTNGFDGRLNSYLNSPELHESAFWGVLGGVMFQAGGSGINRVYNTLMTRAAEKDSKEVQQEKRPWYWLEQLPETKRRIEEIRQRNKIYNKYRNDINQINKGIDIFQDEEQQQEGQLSTEELKEAARQRAFNDYITDITMNAINNGNYDLLKAYLEDDNVRQGMIESGLFNGEGKTSAEIEADSKAFIDNAVKKMDDVAKEYDDELVALNYVTAGRKFKGRVPAEFLGIIAVDNIKARNAIKQQDATIAAIDADIAKEKAAISTDTNRTKLDPSVDYERLMKLNAMSVQLGYLRDQRKKVSKSADSVSKQITLASIDKQIESIEADIKDEELYYVTARSLQMAFDDNGNATSSATDNFLDYYNNVIIGTENAKEGSKIKFDQLDAELLHLPVKALSAPSETTRHAHKLVEQDANAVFGNLKNISERLYNAYQDKAYAEMKKKYLQTLINRTDENVANRVGELTNTFNLARNKAIKNKGKIMTELYLKHGNIIRDIVKAEYNGDTKSLKNLYSQLDSKTVTTIKDVFKVFDFTKTANQNIAVDLENAFDIVDRAETARKERAKKNGEVENATNQQADTEQEGAQPNTSSQTDTNANTSQQNGSQGQQSPQTNPSAQEQPQSQSTDNSAQATQQVVPVANNQTQPAQKNKTKVKIINASRNSFSTSSVDVELENNNDGTFSVVNPELSDLNNKELYDTNGVDLTRPHEVEEKPIVKKQNIGYVLDKKGKVVNTDTAEYQQRKAQEVQAAQQSQNPSTGERGNEAVRQPVSNQRTDTAPEGQQGPAIDNSFSKNVEDALERQHYAEKEAANMLRIAIMPRFIAKKKAGEDVNIDELFDLAVDALVQKGENREMLESQKTVITSLFNRLNKAKSSKLQSSTDELIIQTTVGLFNDNKLSNGFRLDYTKSISNLIEAYCEEFGIPTVNNKKYINFEDLLRYLNSLSEDKLTSSIVYYGLNEYLKTPEAKEKYIRTDELNDNLDEAEKAIRKSEEERQIEFINENLPQRINLDNSPLANVLKIDDEERFDSLESEMTEAYNNSNIGDNLVYEVLEDKVIFKTKNGKIIGSNTIPNIDNKTGVRSLKVTGFVYKLNKDSHGTLISPTKDLIYKWFTEDNPTCKDLRAILYKYTYESLTADEQFELAKLFADNPEVKQAIEDGNLVDITEDIHEAYRTLNHLSRLFKFENIKNTHDVNDLRRSLNRWFDKVYDNYESAIYLSQHPDTEIKISNISEGSLIKNSNNPTEKDLTPVQSSIAGGVNPNVNKLTITSKNGQTLVSGAYPVSNGFRPNTRHIIIPGKNGTKQYVFANAASFADDFIGNEAKEIISELKSHIHKLLTDYANNKNADTFNALKEFLINAFNYNEHSSLFYNCKCYVSRQSNNTEFLIIKSTVNNYELRIGLSEDTIDVFRPDYPKVSIDNGVYNKKKVPLNDNTVFENIDKILSDLRFNISEKLINSDSVSEDANINGIVSKRSNQFTIKIGDKTWTYNSFNEFILNNNLVKVNTHPNESGTSNFEKNQFSSLEYSIVAPQKTSSPVEKEEQKQAPVIPPSMSKTEQAIGILNGTIKVEHKGEALFKLFKDDSKVLESLKNLGLLPKNVIFDENFNKERNDNAQIDVKTGTITVGTKWLELFNTNRSYAMRILIHEQIHNKLRSSKNKGYIQSVRNIFDEFQKSLTEDSVRNYYKYCKEHGIEFRDKDGVIIDDEKGITKLLNSLSKFKYEQYDNPDIRLEEFLVDSLMNGDLIMYLNSVEVKDPIKKTRSNLFKRILEALSELFGWNIEKNSLREKELYALKGALSEPKTTKRKTNKKQLVEQPMIPGLFDEVETEKDNNEEPEAASNEPSQPEQLTEEPVESFEEIADEDELSDEDLEDDEEDMDMADRFDGRESSTDELGVNYTLEMQSIKKQAIANGTYMKAPNGKPTNLNERQWLQVRTKAFKDWFGDWINNPSEASKVIDENGEPLVVYHGSKSIFHTFRNKYETYKEEKYLETSEIKKEVLNTFTDKEKNTLIPLIDRFDDNPFIALSEFTKSEEELFHKYDEKLRTLKNSGKKVIQHYNIGDFFTTDKTYAGTYGTNIYSVFLNIRNHKYDDKLHRIYTSDSRINSLQEEGYDGIIGNDVKGRDVESKGTEYIVFNPNQIKSATDNTGKFSRENDDIRYSSTEELGLSPIDKAIEDSKDLEFNNSIYRAQAATPTINDNGDLILHPTYDSLAKNYGVSFATIASDAIANGTYMKAPNGKPTNLNERQWLQVRTTGFKNWFGDWENPFAQINKPKIIFGHPAIGKTYAIEGKYKDKFIDWDVEYNEKRDKWIEEHSGTKKGTNEYKKARNEYLIHPEKHSDYVEFLTNEWNRVKNKADKENKILLASPHTLLKLFPNDFDYIINVEKSDFISRNVNRGGKEYESSLWKEGIDETISNTNNIPIYNLQKGKYLSDLLDEANNVSKVVDENGEPLVVYHGIIGNEDFNIFNTKIDKKLGQTYGKGSYFTPSHQISLRYTGDRGDNFVKVVFLNIRNPFINDTFLGNNPEDTTKQIQNKGYDGRFIVTEYNNSILDRIPDMFVLNKDEDTITSLDEIIVFNSNQIKSATSNTGEFSRENDDIRYSSTEELVVSNIDKAIEDSKDLEFNNSIYRAQAATPTINDNGDLILHPTYDSLAKNYGVSFATIASDAMDFGTRNSKNPYLIEVDTDYLDTVIPLNREAGTQDENVRAIGDGYTSGGYEQKIQTKTNVVIPKGKYKITRDKEDYSNISTSQLVDAWMHTYALANSSDEIVFSGNYSRIDKGVTSFSDANDIFKEIATRLGGIEQAKEYIDIRMYRAPYSVPVGVEPFYGRKYYEDKGIDITEYDPEVYSDEYIQDEVIQEEIQSKYAPFIDDYENSRIEELVLTTASSFLDAQSQLPIELRSNFASMVDSAAIRSQCK